MILFQNVCLLTQLSITTTFQTWFYVKTFSVSFVASFNCLSVLHHLETCNHFLSGALAKTKKTFLIDTYICAAMTVFYDNFTIVRIHMCLEV